MRVSNVEKYYSRKVIHIVFRWHGHVLDRSEGQPSRFCRLLPANTTMRSTNPAQIQYSTLIANFERQKADISRQYKNVRHIIQWECSFLDQLNNKECDVGKFYAERDKDAFYDRRLKVRDAMRGGHVDLYALSLSTQVNDNKTIFYEDYNSLYPAICMNECYPTGEGFYVFGEENCAEKIKLGSDHYLFYHEEKGDIECFGAALAVCYLPPQNNLKNVPFLPLKVGPRVYYSECLQCTQKEWTDLCTCPKEMRQWVDTYTLLELAYAALYCGYEIRILQALVYLESEKVFQDFFRTMAAFKIMYEPIPEGREACEYLAEVNQSMGLDDLNLALTPDMITPNPSMRTAIKQLMNIAIGKFGEKSDKNYHTFCKNDKELTAYFMDPNLEIRQAQLVTEDVLQLVMKKKREVLPPNRSANVLLNAYTTSYGRLYLFKAIQEVLHKGGSIAYVRNSTGLQRCDCFVKLFSQCFRWIQIAF